jgi:SpoVK/Ycf46/Vps4 family AAA+-type ATPase
MSKGLAIVDALSKFSFVEELDVKGKILIFEKNEYNEMVLTPYPVKGYDLDISKNYNDDFAIVHERLQKWIPDFTAQNNKLVLFNGEPGTGKTNYLKYLLNSTPDVKKIYIPPYFVQSISDPSFFPIIRKEKESLLIIEDAEKILVNREDQADNSTISILLNLCDGIMADVLNFKIIATFNTDEGRIDDALKRKGRMFMHYKFDKLKHDKASALFKAVHGEEIHTKDDMTLADIYDDENMFAKKRVERKIGFGV